MPTSWIFVGAMALLVVSFVLMSVAGFSSRRDLFLTAARLRYLVIGLLFGALGAWMTVGALFRWVDWGSLMVGLCLVTMGAVWLYARGGIGPNFPGA